MKPVFFVLQRSPDGFLLRLLKCGVTVDRVSAKHNGKHKEESNSLKLPSPQATDRAETEKYCENSCQESLSSFHFASLPAFAQKPPWVNWGVAGAGLIEKHITSGHVCSPAKLPGDATYANRQRPAIGADDHRVSAFLARDNVGGFKLPQQRGIGIAMRAPR